MRTNKKIAIVILNWNGEAWMAKFLPSVLKYSPSEIAEVVVADNGSTDNSLPMLAQKFPTVKIIQLDKNYGFAEGYNKAIKQLDNPYCVLLNSDVEVTEGWLDAPLAFWKKKRLWLPCNLKYYPNAIGNCLNTQELVADSWINMVILSAGAEYSKILKRTMDNTILR